MVYIWYCWRKDERVSQDRMLIVIHITLDAYSVDLGSLGLIHAHRIPDASKTPPPYTCNIRTIRSKAAPAHHHFKHNGISSNDNSTDRKIHAPREGIYGAMAFYRLSRFAWWLLLTSWYRPTNASHLLQSEEGLDDFNSHIVVGKRVFSAMCMTAPHTSSKDRRSRPHWWHGAAGGWTYLYFLTPVQGKWSWIDSIIRVLIISFLGRETLWFSLRGVVILLLARYRHPQLSNPTTLFLYISLPCTYTPTSQNQ